MTVPAFQVGPRDRDQTLAALIKRHLALSWSQANRLIEQRRVRINGQVCPDPIRRPRLGARIEITAAIAAKPPRPQPTRTPTARPKPPPTPVPSLVHLDPHIVIVEKPPGLTTMRHAEEAAEFGQRARKYLPTTLADVLPRLIGDSTPLRAVHRLDRDTSGLLVFARTPQAESLLGKQFRAHTVSRRYLALVRGTPPVSRIESWLVPDRGDGRRGSGTEPGVGQHAVTHVRIVEELGNYALVECRLETGRTHQVRIHLGEAGTPLCGERLYDRPIHGAPRPDGSGAARIMLHAVSLGLTHPATGKWLEWESPIPADMKSLLEKLRRG